MLRPAPPMSNAERQRKFRASHPGYNRKYSGHSTRAQRRRATQQIIELQRKCEAHVQLVLRSTICKPLPLLLPAPVVTIELPAMTTLEKINAIAAVSLSRAA